MGSGVMRRVCVLSGGLGTIVLCRTVGAQTPAPAPDSIAARAPTGAGSLLLLQSRAPLPDTTVPYVAELGIADVVAAAQRTSPAITEAVGAVRTGQSGVRVAYGAFVPSASAFAFGLQSDARSLPSSLTPSGTSPTYSAQAYWWGLAGSWDVFTGGRRFADVASARATNRS